MKLRKSEFKYFAISSLICIFTLTLLFILSDLYVPLGAVFDGVPAREVNFGESIHLIPKLPVIIIGGLALNFRKLKGSQPGVPHSTRK